LREAIIDQTLLRCPLWVIRVAFVISANVRFQDDFGHRDFGGGRIEFTP